MTGVQTCALPICGLGPAASDLHAAWLAEMTEILRDATLVAPKASAFRSTGKRGVHSEHMGRVLAELQQLQRTYPGGVW